MSDRDFKIIVLKMLRELKEITDKQFHDIRKTLQKQNKKSGKETENMRKNQTWIGQCGSSQEPPNKNL